MKPNFYEIFFADGYSIAIKGVRMPTVNEAQNFYDTTSRRVGALHDDAHTVTEVKEITEYETKTFFDCSKIDEWPVFGA